MNKTVTVASGVYFLQCLWIMEHCSVAKFYIVLVDTLPIPEQKMSNRRLACTSADNCNKKRFVHDCMTS